MVVPGVLGMVMGAAMALQEDAALDGGTELALVVAAAGILGLASLVWNLLRADELERHVNYVSLSTGFVGTGVVTLVYGVLQSLGWPPLSWTWVFLVGMVFAALGHGVAWYRYHR